MSNQGPSYAHLAFQQLQQAGTLANAQGNPAVIQALATLGQGLATLAQAQETAQLRAAVEEIAKVQVPPNTVPQHEYDEAIRELNKRQATIGDLQAQLRIKDNLGGESVTPEG